ncbi:MAG: glycosyl hydrolase family 28-related protein, partial [Acidaminococcaceae bacterium]
IQKAIDDTASPSSANFGKSVFMPRGHFYVKNTINLKKGTKIFGAGKNISAIQQHQDFKIDGSTFIVDTVNDKNANIVMSDFAILRQEASAAKGLTSSKYVSMLRVRGNNTVFRDIQFAGIEDKQDNYYLNPEVIFSDNAGGKIYNLAVNTNVRAESGGNIHGDYRRVLIDKVTNPLTIYQCGVNNTEKAYMLEIRDSANVTIYAIKFEEQNQLLKIKDSAKIAITGGYGYFTIVDNIDSIITIENSSKIYLAGIGRSSMRKYEERKNKFWLINGQDLLADDYDIILYKSDQLFPQPKTEELLNDAGLERGAVSWQAIGSATIKEEFNFVHQGSRSIKVAQQKSADNGIAQDITDILQKNGPGNYDVSAWIMKGFDTTIARSSNKKSKAEDSKNDAEKQAAAKALIKIEVKHDGTTEYYTLDDKAFNYWNRVSGSVNLSWKRLESARILIALAEAKTEYYIDEVSLSKQNNVENIKVKRNNNKLPGFLLFLLTAVTVGGALVAYKRFRK